MMEQSLPELTDAMRLVLEQKYRLYDELVLSNQKLDDRADRIVQTGSIIIGLGAIASTPVGWTVWPSSGQGWLASSLTLLMMSSFLAFIAIIPISLYIFRPITRLGPGTSNWDQTFNEYVNSSSYFEQILSDLMASIRSAEQLNRYKSRWIPRLIALLVFQTVTLAVAWMLSAGSTPI